jgi:hypothetical protein
MVATSTIQLMLDIPAVKPQVPVYSQTFSSPQPPFSSGRWEIEVAQGKKEVKLNCYNVANSVLVESMRLVTGNILTGAASEHSRNSTVSSGSAFPPSRNWGMGCTLADSKSPSWVCVEVVILTDPGPTKSAVERAQSLAKELQATAGRNVGERSHKRRPVVRGQDG